LIKLAYDVIQLSFWDVTKLIYDYDVAVIGAGITGCAIARWLSKYDLKTIVIEANNDVATGTTKANSGVVHAAYSSPEGTIRQQMNYLGNPMFDQAQRELNFDFKRVGSFIVAIKDEEIYNLEKEKRIADGRGIASSIITDIRRIKTMEPNISDKVKAVFFAPSAGIVWPMGLALALAENAYDNGVKFLLNNPVSDIKKKKDIFEIKTIENIINAKYVINAAGLFADRISAMVGVINFSIKPRKGEYILLDKNVLHLNHILFPIPSAESKGILVCPTTHENTFIGPNSNLQDDKNDKATTSIGLNEVIDGARLIFPSVPIRNAIANFAGLRAISSRDGDFIIEHTKVNGFVNVAGICSPGLSSCLAIADRVVQILGKDVGVTLNQKPNYNPYRAAPKRLRSMNEEELAYAIKSNPLWGRVICRC